MDGMVIAPDVAFDTAVEDDEPPPILTLPFATV